MKKLLAHYFHNSKGFTLVELLVVIGVLGILAAGLLATIDPLEQFRKAQDNTAKEASIEAVNGITRYYATNQVYPWGSGALSVKQLTTGDLDLGKLILQGELKSTFTNNEPLLKRLFLAYTIPSGETQGIVSVCFIPLSKATKNDLVGTNFNGDGTTPATTTKYWCAR